MLTTRCLNFKSLWAFACIFSLSLQGSAATDLYFYVVKSSDTASSILYRSGLVPIYHPNGFLRKLRDANPDTINLNRIYSGQKLTIPLKLVKKGMQLGLIGATTENEIYFIRPNQSAPSASDLNQLVKIHDGDASEPSPRPDAKNQQPNETVLSAAKDVKGQFGFGTGLAFQSFEQNGIETRQLDYSSFTGPSWSLRGGVEWTNGYGIDVSYANYPGELKSSTNAITNNRFSWVAQSLEATYRIYEHSKSKSYFRLRTGVQQHNLPYVQLPTASTAEIRKHEVYFATLGSDYNLELFERWHIQALLRYQIPFSQSKSRDDIQFQQRLSFDGSLGSLYDFNPRFSLGLFWYGQWQEFDYSMLSEATGQIDSGRNRFIFSNLELRIVHKF